MAWIKGHYWPNIRQGEEPNPIFVNTDCVSSVRKTNEGRARVVWDGRDMTLILTESYETVVDRIQRATRSQTGEQP